MDEWIVFQSPARIAHLVKVSFNLTFLRYYAAEHSVGGLQFFLQMYSCNLGLEEGAGHVTGGEDKKSTPCGLE